MRFEYILSLIFFLFGVWVFEELFPHSIVFMLPFVIIYVGSAIKMWRINKITGDR